MNGHVGLMGILQVVVAARVRASTVGNPPIGPAVVHRHPWKPENGLVNRWDSDSPMLGVLHRPTALDVLERMPRMHWYPPPSARPTEILHA